MLSKLLMSTNIAFNIDKAFSIDLWEGNGDVKTITNDIDLSNSGGMVWIKNRDQADSYQILDTERGVGECLHWDTTAGDDTNADTITAFNSNGYSLGADVTVNTNTENYVGYTFRKRPRFFDVVTYTGDGEDSQEVPHSLGVAPGMMIVKNYGSGASWAIYHKMNNGGVNPENYYLQFDTDAEADASSYWYYTTPTSSAFTVGATLNINAGTYVAYLFADTPNYTKCGTYTGTGSAVNVDCGFDSSARFVIIKKASGADSWYLFDSERGVNLGNDPYLLLDFSNAESNAADAIDTYATGFRVNNAASLSDNAKTYIYYAIK